MDNRKYRVRTDQDSFYLSHAKLKLTYQNCESGEFDVFNTELNQKIGLSQVLKMKKKTGVYLAFREFFAE